MATRRIRKPLRDFFENKPLTDREKIFIMGCIRLQEKHPQLTAKQWAIVCDIENRHKEEE